MKEKIIEKRVIKMKKVFVTLLMLMMVVGLFATVQDIAIIEAAVEGEYSAWFSKQETSSSPESADVVLDMGKINENSSVSVNAFADTNDPAGCTVKIYGSALSLYGGENNDTLISSIGINVSDEKNNNNKDFMTPSKDKLTSIGEDCLVFNVVPENGPVKTPLTIKIAEAEKSKLTVTVPTVQAGNYTAYLVIDCGPNA